MAKLVCYGRSIETISQMTQVASLSIDHHIPASCCVGNHLALGLSQWRILGIYFSEDVYEYNS